MVGANPLEQAALAAKNAFVVVQDLFLTETAQAADVVFPASSAYEKSGTVTNVCGEVQRLKKGLQYMGTKPDLEIIGLIAKEMGMAPVVGPWIPDTVFRGDGDAVHAEIGDKCVYRRVCTMRHDEGLPVHCIRAFALREMLHIRLDSDFDWKLDHFGRPCRITLTRAKWK